MIRVLRLNSRTFPVLPEERAALEPAEFELSEAELPEDYPEPEKVDAVMIVSAYFREDMLKKFPNLRIISRLGNGCDKIDLAAAGKRGIPVVNVPDSFSEEVAELLSLPPPPSYKKGSFHRLSPLNCRQYYCRPLNCAYAHLSPCPQVLRPHRQSHPQNRRKA